MSPLMIFLLIVDLMIVLYFVAWLFGELRFFFRFTLPVRMGVRIKGKLHRNRQFR